MIQAVTITKTPVIRWTVNGSERQYQLTETDVLDLTRAAWREGEPIVGVLWTLIQRYITLIDTKRWASLSLYLRSYVQPINPAWFTNGAKHLAKLEKLKTASEKNAEIERAKKREEYARTPLHRIPLKYRNIVKGVLMGTTPSPNKEAQHFAASTAKASMNEATAKKRADAFGKARHLGDALDLGVGYGPKVNWFYRGTKPVPTISIKLEQTAQRHDPALRLVTLLFLGVLASQLL